MNQSLLKSWSMWGVALFFFAYQFIMRLFPGLVMNEIMLKHQVDATAFGFLSSMYYFGYAGMQIPVAILLDRFGPRKIITICALLCSLATLLFISASSWPMALAARFLIGVGSAAGFLGTSKIISLVFPEKQYAKMVGLTFTFGLMGALYGGKPVSMLILKNGWENVGVIIAAVGFLSAALVCFVARTPNAIEEKADVRVMDSLKAVMKSPQLLVLAFANLLMVGSLEGFADVWGVNFLVKAFLFEQSDAAFVISCIFVGMLCGGPLLAWLASRFSADYLVTSLCGLLAASVFAAILTFFPNFSYVAMCSIFFMVGIFCCYQVLVFAIGSTLVGVEHRGISVAFLNCINMLGGSFFHLLIGSLLDAGWKGDLLDGVKLYTAGDYAGALSAIPVCATVGALMILGIGFLRKRV